jgi:spermidine synthase
VYETESTYQYIQVLQREDGSRVLRLNEGVANHSVWHPDSVLTGGEWDMFLVVPPLLDRSVKRILVIGNAGGTTARAYGALYPGVEIDGVEIDPEVSDVGRRYFGLDDNPKLNVIDEDGRPYLRLTDKRYDAILIDAYRQPYIPFYLATKEFFELTRDHLNPGGVLALNVAAVPGDNRLSRALGSTVLEAYPQAWLWPALRFNELLVAFDAPVDRATLARRVQAINPQVASLAELFAAEVTPMVQDQAPLTDDRAPVEWLTDGMIVSYIARSADLDEDFLPTKP